MVVVCMREEERHLIITYQIHHIFAGMSLALRERIANRVITAIIRVISALRKLMIICLSIVTSFTC